MGDGVGMADSEIIPVVGSIAGEVFLDGVPRVVPEDATRPDRRHRQVRTGRRCWRRWAEPLRAGCSS